MVPGDVSPELRKFIQTTINSVEELEVLLFMMSNADQSWSVEEVSERTRLAEVSVREKIKGLVRVKLVEVEVEDDERGRFRYAPDSKAMAEGVAASLDQAYRERKDTVIQLIYSRPFDNIRIFADAFRIKEED